MPITDPVFRRSLYDNESTIVPILLVTITHPSLATPIRVCSERVAVESRGETYEAVVFSAPGLPGSAPGQIPTAQLSLGDVDGIITQQVLAITGKLAQVTIEVVGSHNLDTIQWVSTLDLIASSVVPTGELTMQLSKRNVLEEPFPKQRFIPTKWLNLFSQELGSEGTF